MSLMAIRQYVRSSGGRTALGVVIVAWLNLVLQPCLLAAPMDGTVDVDGAHDGHMLVVDEHALSCDSGQTACCDALLACDPTDVAAAAGSLKSADDTSFQQLSVVTDWPIVTIAHDVRPPTVFCDRARPPSRVSISILNCVFLM